MLWNAKFLIGGENEEEEEKPCATRWDRGPFRAFCVGVLLASSWMVWSHCMKADEKKSMVISFRHSTSKAHSLTKLNLLYRLRDLVFLQHTSPPIPIILPNPIILIS